MRRQRHRLWTVTLAASAVLTTGACGSDDLLGPDALQGVEGIVLRGPMCPVQSEANPCPDQPYQADLDIRTSDGGFVAEVRSETDGTFRVGLRPGRYVLHPESGNPFPTAGVQDVEVQAGEYTQVTVLFDTGIR